MVVKNEDRFIWYSIQSVLPYLDNLLIADTGSTDKTISIIENIRSAKVNFKKYNILHSQEVSKIRQEQLEETNSDWFWLIDADEVYPNSLIEEIKNILQVKGNILEGIVVGRRDLLGDIYHYQDNSAGFYEMWGKKGHFSLRLVNKSKIPKLHVEGIYPKEGYYDSVGNEITSHDRRSFYFTKGNLHHAMYLKRSSINANLKKTYNRQKFKFENGVKIPTDFIPEVFFKSKSSEIEGVTQSRSAFYNFVSSLITPLKKIKRSLF